MAKRYSVWRNRDDSIVIIDGTTEECARAMHITPASFRSMRSRPEHKWHIETQEDLEERDRRFDKMSFGARLQEIRESRHMTRKELSMATGLTRQQISNYEAGVNNPYLHTAVLLANVLEVSLDSLAERHTPSPLLCDEGLQDLGYALAFRQSDRACYLRDADNMVLKLYEQNDQTAVIKFDLHHADKRLNLTFEEVRACAALLESLGEMPWR